MLQIAIDGPVGAGKSTIARALASALGISYLDTGAMYRALALKALREGIDIGDVPAVENLIARTSIAILYRDGGQRTCLDDEDVTSMIRTPDVTAASSAISKIPCVRSWMVALQRNYAEQNDIVLDGRDIGTRVLPNAANKFFLTASAEIRAERRHLEMLAKGDKISFESVFSDMLARDAQDSKRSIDPLRRADDAILVDTSDLSQEEVVALLLQRVREETI